MYRGTHFCQLCCCLVLSLFLDAVPPHGCALVSPTQVSQPSAPCVASVHHLQHNPQESVKKRHWLVKPSAPRGGLKEGYGICCVTSTSKPWIYHFITNYYNPGQLSQLISLRLGLLQIEHCLKGLQTLLNVDIRHKGKVQPVCALFSFFGMLTSVQSYFLCFLL